MIEFLTVLFVFTTVLLIGMFLPFLLIGLFLPLYVVPYMFGLILFAIALQSFIWYAKHRQFMESITKEELTHKYDPPIDPMFGKR